MRRSGTITVNRSANPGISFRHAHQFSGQRCLTSPAPLRLRAMTVTEKLSAYATAASSASRSAGAATVKSGSALVDAVERLVRAAVDRVLLSDDRVTSAADGKLRLSGQEGTEELADKVQRVVVLATPIVRAVARGAKFTRLPWALVASRSVSVGIAV